MKLERILNRDKFKMKSLFLFVNYMLAPWKEVTLRIVGNMFGRWCGKSLIHWHSLVNFLCSYLCTFNLSHHSLNPACVHYWWVNNPSLGEFGLTMIGRVTSKDHKTTTSLQQIEKGVREEKNRLELKRASSDKRIDSTSAIVSPVTGLLWLQFF